MLGLTDAQAVVAIGSMISVPLAGIGITKYIGHTMSNAMTKGLEEVNKTLKAIQEDLHLVTRKVDVNENTIARNADDISDNRDHIGDLREKM